MVAAALGLFALASLAAVRAAPSLVARQSITTLSSSTVSTFKPYTFYASAAYCVPSETLAWNCGTNCEGNPDFIPTASGGDGDSVQFWYVGFDPNLQTVIVAHQGTNTSELLPLLTDGDIFMSSLDSSLFPGVSSSVEAHDGFQDAQSAAATQILAAVQATINKFGVEHVTLVGHSLGAAISLLDAVYLPLHLPGVTFKTVLYGLPRVGNQDFANYVDAKVASFNHINNKEDPIPIVPGRFLGYVHPSGEIHIQDSGAWDACPGQDNTSDLCIVGDVPNIFDGTESDHDGPYDGVEMGC